MSLMPEERADAILQRLQRDGRVLVDAIARELAVSGETIRRDLRQLESVGLLRRSHGGAVRVPPRNAEDLSFPARSTLNMAAKRRIAARAKAYVRNGISLMVDSSSTAQEVMRALGQVRDLTVVTNSMALLSDPACLRHRLISVGGECKRDVQTFLGPLAVKAARQFQADLAIVSVKALSRRSGLMVANAAEADIKQAFIECAARTILVVDSGKFDGSGLVAVAPLSAVHAVVTDKAPSAEWKRLIARSGARLHVAG